MSIILERGTPVRRVFEGKEFQLTPIMAVPWPSNAIQLGFGYLPDGGTPYIWGVGDQHNLIQVWRAMKLLEVVPEIDDRTHRACWEATRRLAPDQAVDRELIRYLQQLFESPQQFGEFLYSLMTQTPDPAKVQVMLEVLRPLGMYVSKAELEAELAAGALPRTLFIEDYLAG